MQLSPSNQTLLIIIALATALISIVFAEIAWFKTGHPITHVEQQQLSTHQTLQTLQDQAQRQHNALLQFETQAPEMIALGQTAYILHLANLTLRLSNNIAETITLLKTAQQRVNAIANPVFVELKIALARDILKLEKLPQHNNSALLLQLDALNKHIQELPEAAPPKIISPSSVPAPASGWQQRWQHLAAALKELVVIRHVNQPITPLLSQQQNLFIKQNCAIKIMLAEWALLHQQPALFNSNLQQVIDWLKQYYADRDDVAKITLALTAMLNQKPPVSTPTLDDSLRALDATLLRLRVPTGNPA